MGESGRPATALLIGRHDYSLDSKNRLGIPPKFREALTREAGHSLYLAAGQESCLYLFLPSQWEKVAELVNFQLKDKTQERAIMRGFFSDATEAPLDSAGRILIPDYLKTHARLGERVLVLGTGTRAEIWDLKRWNLYKQSTVAATFRRASKNLPI